MIDATKKDIMKTSIDKIKLVDAGVKNKYGISSPKPVSDYENQVSYPHLDLDTKEAPMLTGCEVGEEVTLLVKAKVTSHSLREGKDHKNENFCLEVCQIGVVSTKKSETKS